MSANIKDWRERIYASGLKASPAVEEAAMLAEIADLRAALQAQQGEAKVPTDLSKRLREIAQAFDTQSHYHRDTLAGAEEIERYYGGMMAWKKTAEKKDADWQAERMGRVDDRIAARQAKAPAPATLTADFKARFNQLLTSSHNAAFDCGEWDNDGEHEQTYDAVLAKSNAADVALREFVFGTMDAAGNDQAPSTLSDAEIDKFSLDVWMSYSSDNEEYTFKLLRKFVRTCLAAAGNSQGQDAKDAVRYRWLRDKADNYNFDAPLAMQVSGEGSPLRFLAGTDLDEGIDAALAAREGE